ncbi:hypothetical protein V6Z11_A08G238600 [Gossypium hirsutum]
MIRMILGPLLGGQVLIFFQVEQLEYNLGPLPPSLLFDSN